jgi:uncharacterized membrane protein YjgN (DUF898 family)
MDTTTTPAAQADPALRYDGRVGEIYPIFLLNLLLTIVTLGIFRFWAITRMRRYLWSRMSFQNSRLEYTGTGAELFVGFLLAGLVLAGIAVVAFGLSYLIAHYERTLALLPILLFYVIVLIFAFGAPFAAQRYRLSRTLWRGIRGGMRGSMFAYGLRALLYMLSLPFTLFQLVPWVQFRLAERRINASSFGSADFHARFYAGRVYGRFVLTLLGVIALGAFIGGIAWVSAVGPGLEEIRLLKDANGGQVPPEEGRQILAHFATFIVIAELAFIVGASLIGTLYRAFVLCHMAENSSLGPMQFSGSFTGPGLLWLYVGNLLILGLTLGLGYPFVLNRSVRYVTGNVRATGSLDPAALGQTEQPAPRFGEGMFQQLDHGGVF